VIHSSPLPDVAVPRVSLPGHVLAGCGARTGRPALVDGTTGETLTYGELDAHTHRAARGLAAAVPPGATDALVGHNQPAYAVALFAVLRAGAAVAPMSPMLTADELAAQFTSARARAVIASAPAAGRALEAARRVGIAVHVLGEHPGCRPFRELLDGPGRDPHPVADPASAAPSGRATA
jgi:acyl-CoA synthetase (AMP-forming)/AMP-acid ligase II